MLRTPHNCRWIVVSVSKPVMMRRSDDETWLLNPRRRYILNADAVQDLSPYIETMFDLEGSAYYKPVRAASPVRLPGASVLVERYRDRGIGDLLFTTGPLAYLKHITGGSVQTYFYTYAERGAVLCNCPSLSCPPLVGPVLYDDLPLYDYHWFIDTVTEHSEESTQLNVYDALYASLGIESSTVDVRFKRPVLGLSEDETRRLDDFFYWVFLNTKLRLDLRNTGYYVVAPLANSSSRCAPYSTWLQVIETLSQRRPVLVVGMLRDRMPSTDMSVGDFVSTLDAAGNDRVVNLMGKTQVRHLLQLLSKANCVASLDSAALYISEAFRTPCVSVWGTHNPLVRIGYDPDYMNLAVWPNKACRYSPCYAWQGFPAHKCPVGEAQSVCQCLIAASPSEIVSRFDRVEERTPPRITLPPPKAVCPENP